MSGWAHVVPTWRINRILSERHYLGPLPTAKGWAWSDEFGCAVLANPTSRALPHRTWLELVRWCLFGIENGGSQQWSRIAAFVAHAHPSITTIVSYSDPSAGHTGALYRASNWLWAPTWHRLRPPPSGNGKWTDKHESVKDRWVYPLRPDSARHRVLTVKDSALLRLYPWAEYREPHWSRRGRRGGGGDFRRFIQHERMAAA